jgi:hypothetical protein
MIVDVVYVLWLFSSQVLKRWMMELKLKWRDEPMEYIYMCSQLKAVRQDLIVQHIQNGRALYFLM